MGRVEFVAYMWRLTQLDPFTFGVELGSGAISLHGI